MNYSRKYIGIGMFVLAGAALLMPHALASSAQRQAQQQRPEVPIRIETDLVAIDVTATDAGGQYVRDLRAEEFQIFEDGRERPIDFFALTDEATLSRPIAVVFALDLSGSLRPEETTTLRSAALRFTELMKGDAVFAAMTFNHNVKIIQRFTDDPRRIESAFGKANKFEGSTRIYDSIDRAVTMLAKQAPRQRRGRPVRRVVVVITDGFDSASTIDRKEMVRRAIEAEVTVYSVTLPSYMLSATQSIGRVITPLDATRIVAATGGRDFAADARDFTPIFRALAEEIRASYVLAYYPDRRDGKYHEVRVQTTRPGVRLRTNRTGYVAPTP
ncbi:MAG: VWA domain-containing protein [Blastocatellales bacterium]|nr:VWA domain-containing protein [Blastocatellales bacterium]